MPSCKVCEHPNRAAIEARLAQRKPLLRVIGQEFGFSKDALHRHAKNCMTKNPAEKPSAPDNETVSRWKRMYARVERLLKKAERKGNDRVAAELIGRLDDLQERMNQAGATEAKREPQIRVVYDELPGFAPLTHQAIRHYAADLLLSETDEPDVAKNETLLACIAYVVANFREKPLPAALRAEVDAKIKFIMEGHKVNADGN